LIVIEQLIHVISMFDGRDIDRLLVISAKDGELDRLIKAMKVERRR